MTKHEWRDRAEDGELVYHQALHHAGRWSFKSTRKSDPDWMDHETPPLELVESFRDVLYKKYQRRRVPHSHMEQIDALLEELKESIPTPEDEETSAAE
ncbi:MAG: hypothetical protein AAF226_16395 [Verrucomicrobiota bacterium]